MCARSFSNKIEVSVCLFVDGPVYVFNDSLIVLYFQVPELFYLPEIFTNENSIDFGTTQLGEKIGNSALQ